jgi:hypothetical protein
MKLAALMAALGLVAGCSASSMSPAEGSATYSISGTELMVFDSVSYSNGMSQLVTGRAPLDGWHRSVGFPLPGDVEGHLYVVALGAGRAVFRVSWTVDGVSHSDSAVTAPTGPGIGTLSIPRHVVAAP